MLGGTVAATQITANAASTQANTATTAASAAQSTASGAFTQANTATTAAASAQSAANSATLLANTASAAASTAQSAANSAALLANTAYVLAANAFQTVSPIKTKNLSGITNTFSAPPNWSVTLASAGSASGAGQTTAAVIPFYCDKNVLITGMNLITPNVANSVTVRQAIYAFDPVNFTLGTLVYAGKPLTAAASSKALLTDASSGVLGAGWYAYVFGFASSATFVPFSAVVGGVSMYREIYGYSNGAGTSIACFTIPTTASEVTTSGFTASTATPLTNFGGYYTPLMNWTYTTDAPRAFV